MNNIVERRIEQFITTKFLKTESEVTLITFLVKTIESDYKKNAVNDVLVAKQIENKQIHVLNTVRNSFQDGSAFLKYFNFKNNNIAFSKLNGIKIMQFVNSLDNIKSTDIVSALNKGDTRKNILPKHRINTNKLKNNNVKIIHKKSKESL